MERDIKITLFSKEEYSQYYDNIPIIGNGSWWLRSKGGLNECVVIVKENGYVYHYGHHVTNINNVRPVLNIVLETHRTFLNGSTIRIGSKGWTILGVDTVAENKVKLCTLCNEFIAVRRFDADNNNWIYSELKQWLEWDGMKKIF